MLLELIIIVLSYYEYKHVNKYENKRNLQRLEKSERYYITYSVLINLKILEIIFVCIVLVLDFHIGLCLDFFRWTVHSIKDVLSWRTKTNLYHKSTHRSHAACEDKNDADTNLMVFREKKIKR